MLEVPRELISNDCDVDKVLQEDKQYAQLHGTKQINQASHTNTCKYYMIEDFNNGKICDF